MLQYGRYELSDHKVVATIGPHLDEIDQDLMEESQPLTAKAEDIFRAKSESNKDLAHPLPSISESIEMADFDDENETEIDPFMATNSTDNMSVNSGIKLMSKKMKRELVIAFYTARLFLPGFFNRTILLIIGLIVPWLDFGTDYYNAGSDT